MDAFSNYAKIGHAKILCLIGLQENYIKEVQILDAAATGCSSCPHNSVNRFLSCDEETEIDSPCSKCNVIYKTKKIYVNEKNQYGRNSEACNFQFILPPRLKSGAIRLYIALHFCDLSSSGVALCVNIKELAELLSCNKKTIFNNLEQLSKYDYIHYVLRDNNHVDVIIKDYSSIFKPASEGGRGYLLLNNDLLHIIASIKSTNALRLLFRLLKETSQQSPRAKLTFKEIRRYFPAYVKPHIIRTCLSDVTDPFFEDARLGTDDIRVTLSEKYRVSNIRGNQKKDNFVAISDYINQIREATDDFNRKQDVNDPRLSQLNIHLPDKHVTKTENDEFKLKYDAYQHLDIYTFELNNLVNLSIEYSVHDVTTALSTYYNSFVQKRIDVKTSLGAIIRTLIRDERAYTKNSTSLKDLIGA